MPKRLEWKKGFEPLTPCIYLGLLSKLLSNTKSPRSLLEENSIAVWGKGAKQRKVCFGTLTHGVLERDLDEYSPTDGLIGLKPRGVAKVLAGLESLLCIINRQGITRNITDR